MPLYEWECRCGARYEEVRPVKKHSVRIKCKECDGMAVQVLGLSHVVPDIEPYKSMVTGERIRGRSHHREHLREHGLAEIGNESIKPRKPKPLPPLAEDIRRAIAETRHR
jgi:putative FmdB family regulatory protein